MRERYGFRELKATTLAHEYTLNRSDTRDKSSLAVLHLLQLEELNELVPLGYGQSELKHALSLKVDGVYVPASVAHVSYLMAPSADCEIKCYIDSAVRQPALFEQSAVFIARIKLHEDSKPYHPKAGKGGGKPFRITIKEAGKADVVLDATSATDGVELLKKKAGITTDRYAIKHRLSGRVASDFVKDGKTCKFAFTPITLPKKEELEQDMYLMLPFNNEKILEALCPGFSIPGAAKASFLDLKAFRADPLRFFQEQDDIILSDEEKLIVARGLVTKDELKDKLLPYLTGYKTRIDAQCDEFLPSENFINAHVASPELDEDVVVAKMQWLYDAVDAYDDAYAAAQAAEAALAAQRKAAKASGKAQKKPSRKRKASDDDENDEEGSVGSLVDFIDDGDEEMAAIDEEPAANAEDCVSDDDVESHHGDSSDDSSSDDDDVMPVARPLPDNHGPQSFERFDRVEAYFRPENKWYPATVHSPNDDGTYNVDYDDEYFEPDLPANLVRPLKRRKVAAPPAAGAYQIGDRVEARYMDGNWFPGKVKTCHKEGTYAIKFDDGDVDDLVFPCDMRAAP